LRRRSAREAKEALEGGPDETTRMEEKKQEEKKARKNRRREEEERDKVGRRGLERRRGGKVVWLYIR
jgi:hypothetical protein